MRVTENTNFETIRESIRRSKGRMEELQTQSATLKKLNQPSDDPVGAAKVLEIRTDQVNNEQYQTNARMAETYLDSSEQALSELASLVLRAKELAISQSSGASSSPETRTKVAEEVSQLLKQAISVGNRKVGDRYIFGGFKTQRPPVDSDGNFKGDDGQMMVEVGNDVFITMNISGNEAFNTHPIQVKPQNSNYKNSSLQDGGGDKGENFNVFDELQKFNIALLTNDSEGIHEALDGLDEVFGSLTSSRAKLGSRLQGLQTMVQSIERHHITNAMLSSSIEDADMAQVVSDLNKEETVFKNSLASAKRLIQPTLLDFLR